MHKQPDQLPNPADLDDLVQSLKHIALKAGAEIMTVYGGDIAVELKDDDSPVTEADGRAEAIILKCLKDVAPQIPVVSEEAASAGDIPDTEGTFFLVDPLDGTKEFISRNGEFTVNIALIVDHIPQAGVVYAPVLERMFYASGQGRAFEIKISPEADQAALNTAPAKALQTNQPGPDGVVVVASRSHRAPETEAYLEHIKVKDFVAAGSSLKFCLVAAGEAHLYPRHGRTMEWDTAAGHAVLRGAGGEVTQFDGLALFIWQKKRTGLPIRSFWPPVHPSKEDAEKG